MKRPVQKTDRSRPALILFNKPYQVLCQFTDANGRKTLADYIPIPDIYAAGRLDYDSEGLVALTNSGRLTHIITDPSHKLPKTYFAQVERAPNEAALNELRKGVLLNDGMTKTAKVELIGENYDIWPRVPPIRYRKNIPAVWLRLTITEGRNRQVRRMTAAIGHPTLRLVRVKIGPLALNELLPGQWKKMPLSTIQSLLAWQK